VNALKARARGLAARASELHNVFYQGRVGGPVGPFPGRKFQRRPPMLLRPGDHVLFFGDSITDAGRREKHNHNERLGIGYVALVASTLLSRHPRMHLTITNRGFSGNRVYDLEKRLQEDVLDAKPTVVSILIGINDTWHQYSRNLPSPVGDFLAAYRRICTRIRDELRARLVICEPFLLYSPQDHAAWRDDFNARRAAVREIGAEFASVYIPLDSLFAAAARQAPAAHWAGDGVHPTPAGHGLIADAWLRAVCGGWVRRLRARLRERIARHE
jgi:acyl-CoA thioesterase-1